MKANADNLTKRPWFGAITHLGWALRRDRCIGPAQTTAREAMHRSASGNASQLLLASTDPFTLAITRLLVRFSGWCILSSANRKLASSQSVPEFSGSRIVCHVLRISWYMLLLTTAYSAVAEPSTTLEVSGRLTVVDPRGGQGGSNQSRILFQIFLRDCNWKVITRPPFNPNSQIEYYESGYDGQVQATLFKVLEGAVYPEALVVTNFSGEGGSELRKNVPASDEGRVFPGGIPAPGEWYSAPVWLAYSSATCLERHSPGLAGLPRVWGSIGASYHDSGHYPISVEWLSPAKSFPRRILFYSDGTRKGRRRDTGELFESKYPPPFDKGFVVAEFNVTKSTNVGGIALPRLFELVSYVPVEGASDTNALRPVFRIEGVAESVRHSDSVQKFLPEITGKLGVEDYRFLGNTGGQRVRYAVTNNTWPDELSVSKMGSYRSKVESGLTRKMSPGNLNWLRLALLAIVLSTGVCLILFFRKHRA